MKSLNESSPEITVLLPKKSFKEGSRNKLTELMTEAGYNDPASGNMGRIDEVTSQAGFYESSEDIDIIQGGVRFRFVKDIGRLATQMRLMQLAEKPAITITGGDSLIESYLRVTQQVQGTVIEKVASLGIGPCTLEWQTPEEDSATSIEALSGRELFSKYPEYMRYLLRKAGVEAQTYESEGADTNINDFRREGITNTGALEIVGTGETARVLKLRRNPLLPEDSPIEGVSPAAISTDIFIINPQNICRKTQMAAMTVCDAVESAKPEEGFTSLKVNIPASKLPEIEALNIGLIGPSVQEVRSQDGQEWVDVTLVVPNGDANGISTRLKLIADDTGTVSTGARDIRGGGNAATSQSIQYFKNLN